MSSGKSLAGGEIGNWRAYNISSDPKHGIGAWPQEALVSYLSKGYAPGYGGAGGPMADAVEHSLRFLSPEDVNAIAVYLKSTPARSQDVARPAVAVNNQSEKGLGNKVFTDSCVGCHRLDGTGNQSAIATLIGLKTVNDPAGTNLMATLLEGHTQGMRRVDQRMPDFARAYNDTELAAVSTFVLRRFGQSNGQVKAEDVAKSREASLH
jgi:mono/diheme cytochrome c family protein